MWLKGVWIFCVLLGSNFVSGQSVMQKNLTRSSQELFFKNLGFSIHAQVSRHLNTEFAMHSLCVVSEQWKMIFLDSADFANISDEILIYYQMNTQNCHQHFHRLSVAS